MVTETFLSITVDGNHINGILKVDQKNEHETFLFLELSMLTMYNI